MLRLAILVCTSLFPTLAGAQETFGMPMPPMAAKVPFVVSSPHGDRVDNYFWLRDDHPKVKRPEVLQYLQAENAYTAAMMAPLAGLQQKLLNEMRARIRPDESTPPAYDRGWWTWTEYTPGAEYPHVMRRRGGPQGPDDKAPPQVVLDQPALAQGKAYFNVGGMAVSPDGKLLAWAEDTGGRRVHTLRIRNLVTGQTYPDAVPGVMEDLVWSNDNRSLFYIRQDPVTLQGGPVYRHTLGTDASQDVNVYEEADKTLFVGLAATTSRRFVLIRLRGGDMAETRAIPADRPTAAVQMVLARRPTVRHSVDHLDGRWLIVTNEGAPNFKLVSARESASEMRSCWLTLVPGRDDASLERALPLRSGIALQERVQAEQRVRLLVKGRSQPLNTPPGHTVTLGANPDPDAAFLRYSVTSLVQPRADYDLHLATRVPVLRKQRDVPGYDASLYATERLWAPSRDGKRIPVTIAWRRDKARPDGTAPLLVYGYGSYGYSMDANFGANRISLLDRGFVWAIAHVRGGADMGQAWFEDGRLANKQNSFNDFVDATDHLLKVGWAARDKVFAIGGSAGGLLVGAVANQAGERYRGMVVAVPFVDVVTTMLDETIPLTVNEYTQWGDPRQKQAYETMLAYSPYDNLAAKPYPAMYVSSGLWDSQVQYHEPAKFVAKLRALKTDSSLLLLDTDMSAGHGGASGRFAALDRTAREFAFLVDLAARAPGKPRP